MQLLEGNGETATMRSFIIGFTCGVYRAQPALALLHRCIRIFLVGDVQVRADELQSPSLTVALNLRDSANPTCLTVTRSNYAIFSLIVFIGACDCRQKVLLNSLSIFWVNTRDPCFVSFANGAWRKAMVEIFW